jgi:hypothetical protein
MQIKNNKHKYINGLFSGVLIAIFLIAILPNFFLSIEVGNIIAICDVLVSIFGVFYFASYLNRRQSKDTYILETIKTYRNSLMTNIEQIDLFISKVNHDSLSTRDIEEIIGKFNRMESLIEDTKSLLSKTNYITPKSNVYLSWEKSILEINELHEKLVESDNSQIKISQDFMDTYYSTLCNFRFQLDMLLTHSD